MTQATRTSVGSTSRYSATPPQTPASFLFFRERVSLLCGEGGVNIAAPQWQQKLTFSSYSLPHWGQNMAQPPRRYGHSDIRIMPRESFQAREGVGGGLKPAPGCVAGETPSDV